MKVDEIKALLKSGDVAGAEASAQEVLSADPDNVQALMLYGTCRQLQGDEATARLIQDKLAPSMKNVAEDETLRMWRKYGEFVLRADVPPLRFAVDYAKAGAALMEYVIIGGLVVVALGVAAYLFGRQVGSNALYGGPEMLQGTEVAVPNPKNLERGYDPRRCDTLYAGPPRCELWMEGQSPVKHSTAE